MSAKIFYTPKHAIPAFMTWKTSDGVWFIQFKNNRTGKTETMRMDLFISILQKMDDVSAK